MNISSMCLLLYFSENALHRLKNQQSGVPSGPDRGLTTELVSLHNDPDRSVQTEDADQEQFDQGLHCLPFCLHPLDVLLCGKTKLFKFSIIAAKFSGV